MRIKFLRGKGFMKEGAIGEYADEVALPLIEEGIAEKCDVQLKESSKEIKAKDVDTEAVDKPALSTEVMGRMSTRAPKD